MSRNAKAALVLSGGGSYAAYEVGVMRALGQGTSSATGFSPLEPEIFTGTSAGAYNATFMASRGRKTMREAAAELETIWLDWIAARSDGWGNGVYRYRLNPFKFLDPRVAARRPLRTLSHLEDDFRSLSPQLLRWLETLFATKSGDIVTRLLSMIDISALISLRPFEETLRRTIDFETVRSSPKFLSVVATNWRPGQLLFALKNEMTRHLGPKLVKGSASIPGIFPPETIAAEKLVDGGVLMNTPLDPAVHAGAEVIYVITLSPRTRKIPLMLLSTLGTFNRTFLASWEYRLGVALRNVAAWKMLAKHRQALRNHAGLLDPASRHQVLRLLDRALEEVRDGLGDTARNLTIHLFHPSRNLGAGPLSFLDFSRSRIAANIQMGLDDATEHDCEKNGCVFGIPREVWTLLAQKDEPAVRNA